MGEYSKAAVIKYTRKATGMTQEELSEGICEPVTISRYENGLLNPSDEKFVRLMQKMGENGNTCLFPLHCEMADLQKEMEIILHVPFAFENGGTRVIHYTPETYSPVSSTHLDVYKRQV